MDYLLRVHMNDNKLLVWGECSTNNHEMYLPNCTEEQIKQFLTDHVEYMAHVLSEARPWRPISQP